MTRRHVGAGWANYPPDTGPPPRGGERAFVDTGVLVAAVDTADADRRTLARGVLAAGAYREVVLSAQVLSEFHLAVRRLAVRVDADVARGLVRELGRSARVVAVTAADVIGAMEVATAGFSEDLSVGEELRHRESLVVRSAIAAGCDVLLTTALPDGLRFAGLDGSGGLGTVPGSGGLVVEDPFADVTGPTAVC